MGYAAGAAAYRLAAAGLTPEDMAEHYTRGLEWFHELFTPGLKRRLYELSGGVWDLTDYVAWAAGSDTDLITHLLEALSSREEVALYPGDWYGFLVGGTWDSRMVWTHKPEGRPAALCVPSVRNGHFTSEMAEFLEGAPACLLNINLYPTLSPAERAETARALLPVMERSLLSVSFSRGFGLTSSQLGVALIHKDHPWNARFKRQWGWSTFFYNALAARAFLALDLDAVEEVDRERRAWVADQLALAGLPCLETGSYYVRSFRPEGELPGELRPLERDGVVRFCMKPPIF